MDSPPVLFPVDSELGRAYIGAMSLEFAYEGYAGGGRCPVHDTKLQKMRARIQVKPGVVDLRAGANGD